MQNTFWARARVWVPVLWLAFALRMYQLGNKSLWGDEIAQAAWSAWDWARLWKNFLAPPDFILHFALVHLIQSLGTDEFWVRLPSALTSSLAVPMTYVLARRLTNRATALTAMLLMAVAPYQIWYAQEARMYAPLCLYALVSLYCFLRLLALPRAGWLVGFWLGGVLGLYNHLFGVFPLVLEGFSAFGILAAACLRARRVLVPRWFWYVANGWLLIGASALPLLPGVLRYAVPQADVVVPGEFVPSPPFQLSLDFLALLVREFGLSAGEFWRTLVGSLLAVFGWLVLARTHPRSFFVSTIWCIAPLALLALLQPRHGVVPRYLIFLQPMLLLWMAYGATHLAHIFAHRFAQRAAPRVQWASALAGLCILALWMVPPLSALYRRAKSNDWRALTTYIVTHAEPGDVLVGEKGTWVWNTLTYYAPNMLAFSTPPAGVETLRGTVAEGRRMWYVSLGEYFDAESARYAEKNLQRIPDAAWQRADLEYTPRDEFSFIQAESPATLYFSGGDIPAEIIYRARRGVANRGVPQLRVEPNETVAAKLKLTGTSARALEISLSASSQAQFEIKVNGKILAQGREKKAEQGDRVLRWSVQDEPEVMLVEVRNSSDKVPLFLKSIALRNE